MGYEQDLANDLGTYRRTSTYDQEVGDLSNWKTLTVSGTIKNTDAPEDKALVIYFISNDGKPHDYYIRNIQLSKTN